MSIFLDICLQTCIFASVNENKTRSKRIYVAKIQKNNMKKVVKIEKILIDKDKIPKIMKIFGCGKATVYNALAYRSNSQQAQDIRSCALNRYGAEPVQVPQLVSV